MDKFHPTCSFFEGALGYPLFTCGHGYWDVTSRCHLTRLNRAFSAPIRFDGRELRGYEGSGEWLGFTL